VGLEGWLGNPDGYASHVNRVGKILRTMGHLVAAMVVGLLDFGETRWLRKRLDDEDDQVGRLI
jgi:hypothetical protein